LDRFPINGSHSDSWLLRVAFPVFSSEGDKATFWQLNTNKIAEINTAGLKIDEAFIVIIFDS